VPASAYDYILNFHERPEGALVVEISREMFEVKFYLTQPQGDYSSYGIYWTFGQSSFFAGYTK